MVNIHDSIPFNEYALTRLKFAVASHLPLALADETHAEVFVDEWARSIVGRLQMSILAEQYGLHETYGSAEMDYYVPASWWQHLKRDYFPWWFKRRWSVKFKKHTRRANVRVKFDATVAFPDMTARYPEAQFGRVVRVVQAQPMSPGDFTWESE